MTVSTSELVHQQTSLLSLFVIDEVSIAINSYQVVDLLSSFSLRPHLEASSLVHEVEENNIPIIDLLALFNLHWSYVSKPSSCLAILKFNDKSINKPVTFGFLTDSYSGQLQVDTDEIKILLPREDNYGSGIIKRDENVILVIDPEAIFNKTQLEELSNFSTY